MGRPVEGCGSCQCGWPVPHFASPNSRAATGFGALTTLELHRVACLQFVVHFVQEARGPGIDDGHPVGAHLQGGSGGGGAACAGS